MTKHHRDLLLSAFVTAGLVGCAPGVGQDAALDEPGAQPATRSTLMGPVAGSIPTGLPARLTVGLFEDHGKNWMKNSGVPWDVRYRYFTKHWVNNWGWGSYDGSWGLQYFREADAIGATPAVAYYQMHGEPGGGESAFLTKAQNATTMKSYFGDFKILMQRVKDFGKPVYILLEADGFAFLQNQSNDNPHAYAAVAATGLPELSGLPNTIAGWGMAFLQMKKAVGATNAILGIHVSGWASGKDILYFNVTDSLQPEVDEVYDFLAPMGLAANQTGLTYDVLVGDPLDRDSDFYRLTQGQDRWWDASDTASVSSRSFNRFAEWLRLWNIKSDKRWVLWQIPLGNSNHRNVHNDGTSRAGYKDNRPEYFFGTNSQMHLEKFASAGVISLMFGAGVGGQSWYTNDTYTDGQLFMKSRAGAYLNAGGLAIPATPGGGTTDPPPPTTEPEPQFSGSALVSPASATAGATVTISAAVANSGGSVSGIIVDVEVYSSAGARVFQQYFHNQSFAAGETKTFAVTLPAPQGSVTYTVAVGVFGANWTPCHAWNGSAASFSVISAPTAPGDAVQYGFEGGTHGWTRSGGMISGVSSSTARAYAGISSLAVQFGGSTGGTQMAYVASPSVAAGSTVTFHVWIPAGAPLSWVQPFVQEGSSGGWRWTGTWRAVSGLQKNAWNAITVTVPPNAGALYRLGVQFNSSGAWSGAAFVDSVSW